MSRRFHQAAIVTAALYELGNPLFANSRPMVSKSVAILMKTHRNNKFILRSELEKLAIGGDCVAQYLFGLLRQYYEEPAIKVMPWFRKAASCGVVAAEVPLASMVANTGDQAESTKLYLTAAHHGDPVAFWFVANAYKNDYLHKGQINGAKALAWYRLAERRGDHKMTETCRGNIAWLRHSLPPNEVQQAEILYNELINTIPISPRYPDGFDENWLTVFNNDGD